MTPEDFAADLSGRLRQRGVAFRPTDFQAFAANARPELLNAPDIEALVDRFREYVEQLNLARRGRRLVWEGLLLAAPAGVCAGASVAAGLGAWSVPVLNEWGVDWIPMGIVFPIAAMLCGVGVISAVQGVAVLARSGRQTG
ncbi:MAG TPA: hypothetical protein VMS17_31220 [Gemmataceae bacterium]|nr:hypothetical protein [Gemmataceae bacterium]